MRKVILVSIFLFFTPLIGCSSLKCGCGGEEKQQASSCGSSTCGATSAAKDSGNSDKKSCGCEGCKHSGSEACSMKK